MIKKAKKEKESGKSKKKRGDSSSSSNSDSSDESEGDLHEGLLKSFREIMYKRRMSPKRKRLRKLAKKLSTPNKEKKPVVIEIRDTPQVSKSPLSPFHFVQAADIFN